MNLRGSLQPAPLAQRGADKLWELIHGGAKKGYVNCLGALTGGQAVQQAKAGIEAIYLSGWRVAADNNLSPPCTRIGPSTRPTPSPPWWSASTTLRPGRPDPVGQQGWTRGQRLHRLLSAHRGGCGSRFRRRAERLRADERDD